MIGRFLRGGARSDVIRKELWGVAPMVMLSETAYAPEFSARVFR